MFNSDKVNSTVIKIVGGFAIILTLILFFMVTTNRDIVHWLGLGFLIVSEVMFFFGAPLIAQTKPQYNVTLLASGTAIILALYMGIALILSLLSGLFINAFTVYVIMQSTFFFVSIILTLILYFFSHKVNKDIEKILLERELEHGEQVD